MKTALAPRCKRLLSDAASLAGLYRLAGSWCGGVGVVFTLHRVVEPGRPLLWPGYEVHLDQLERVLTATRRLGWEIVSLDEARRRLESGAPGRRFACFTFDDGYADNLRLALPLFRRHQAPLCVYVTTGLVERWASYWWGALGDLVLRHDAVQLPGPQPGLPERLPARSHAEKQAAYSQLNDLLHLAAPETAEELFRNHGIDPRVALDRDLLDPDGVRELAADPLATVGAHGASHQVLAALSEEVAARELAGTRSTIAAWTGKPVLHLAYPFGGPVACGPREFDLAGRAGYATAVTTRRGNLFPEHRDHLLCLPRREIPVDRIRLRHTLFGVESLFRRVPMVRTA